MSDKVGLSSVLWSLACIPLITVTWSHPTTSLQDDTSAPSDNVQVSSLYAEPNAYERREPDRESYAHSKARMKRSVSEQATCTGWTGSRDTTYTSGTFTPTSAFYTDLPDMHRPQSVDKSDHDQVRGDDYDKDNEDGSEDESKNVAEDGTLTRRKRYIEYGPGKANGADDGNTRYGDLFGDAGRKVMKIQSPRDSPHSNTDSIDILRTTPASRMFFTRVTSWSVTTSSQPYPDIPCDDYVCDCSAKKRQVTCCGRSFKLHHIPRVPAYTRKFRIWMASIFTLDRHTLGNLSNFNIQEMDLRNNRIKFIANDTFADFHHLTNLFLGENPISVEMLRNAFYSIRLQSFTILSLDNMILGNILPADFLGAFQNHSLQSLSVQSNGIIKFQSKVFSGFRAIKRLDLTGNDIRDVELDAKVWVQALKLENNSITTLPVLCLSSSTRSTGSVEEESAFPNLYSLYLADNPLKRIPADSLRGSCLPKLHKLDISGSSVSCLENNFVADLPSLQKLMIQRMTNLRRYDPFCFNSSSLSLLSIVDSKPGWTRGTVDPVNVFAHSPSLHTLQLSGTSISLPDDHFRSVLLSLQSIEILKLAKCTLGSIPADTLWRLQGLVDLDLNSNHLNPFTVTTALKNVTQIRTLRLQGNNINTVNDSTFPEGFLGSVRTLDISQNPFDCTCSILWFKSWADAATKSGNITITSYPKEYYCNTPAKWKNARLSDYNPSYRDCHPVSVYTVAGGVAGSLFVLLVSSLSLVYRYRWYLRYYIYRLRRRRQYKQLSNDEEDPFAYSIYLGYSERDLEWIVTELLPLLEVEAHHKVYLKNRDILGGTEADNIVLNMDRSERVLLVLSNNYTQEAWSGFEFQNTLFAGQEQGKEVLVVLKGEVGPSRMSRDMCRMLTKGTFLQWEDTGEARATFREGLLLALGCGGGETTADRRWDPQNEHGHLLDAD